ncbi:MAG: hypothetical protein O3A87_09745, partial [Verrucomicrobia bacterium]|nr:hypothetical protein [Verrucomicrobiota bacterium]
DAPINIDELGNVVATDTQVWTGSRATYAGQWGYPAAWPYGADGNTETAGYYWNSLGDRAPGYYRYGRVGQTGSKWIAGPERIGGSLSFYALSEELTIGSALSIKLAVTYVPASDNLVFTWNSQSGMLYDLLSATDLTTAPDTPWAVYDDGVTVTTDLEADPSGTNTLTVPRPTADATRFFAILEKDSPPLLSEDFEANDGGFTASKTTGTDWAHGAPTSGSAGSPNAGGFVDSGAGSPPAAQCWGTDIGNPGFYADPTTDSCLSSPVIDLSVIAGAELRFAQALDFPAGDTAVVRVIDVSTSTEIVSGPFPLTVTDSAPTSALWENAGPYALPVGGQIRIEWCFSGTGDTSDDYMGWYIDDVRVTAD